MEERAKIEITKAIFDIDKKYYPCMLEERIKEEDQSKKTEYNLLDMNSIFFTN